MKTLEKKQNKWEREHPTSSEINPYRIKLGKVSFEYMYLSKQLSEPEKASRKVNGYREATTRYITSGTYERAQKRQERAILRNMGVNSYKLNI